MPALLLPDDTASSGKSLVVLRPLELLYREHDTSSTDYGDLFHEKNIRIVDTAAVESIDVTLGEIESTLQEMEQWEN